jgi:hypothetical protein
MDLLWLQKYCMFYPPFILGVEASDGSLPLPLFSFDFVQ